MNPLEFLTHIDEQLHSLINQLGPLTYWILFLIIFAETGLVVIPFLPGDSLLFAAGTLAGAGLLNLSWLMPALIVAAILGDGVNYWIGSRLGARAFARQNSRLFKPEHLAKTEAFFAKYGGKTIIIARFVPIVRTFAPFVAGVGSMSYRRFAFYNVIGALIWVISLTLAGYFFGSFPVVRDNFEIVILGIVAISLLPGLVELFKHLMGRRRRPSQVSYQEVKETFKEEHISE